MLSKATCIVFFFFNLHDRFFLFVLRRKCRTDNIPTMSFKVIFIINIHDRFFFLIISFIAEVHDIYTHKVI